MNNTLERILEILEQRGWSKYKLAKESCIPYSSLNSLFIKNNQPTISTLNKICDGLNITMSDFFKDQISECIGAPLSNEEKSLLLQYNSLNKKNKRIIMILLKELQD